MFVLAGSPVYTEAHILIMSCAGLPVRQAPFQRMDTPDTPLVLAFSPPERVCL